MTVAALRRRCQARGALRGEDGVTLILALAFITLLGAFVVALLALTQANFKTTTVTRTRIDALYTADAGADFALEQVRTTATASCPPGIAAAPAANGVTPAVSITCTGGTTTAGGSPLLGAYSAIALGASGVPVSGSAQDGDNLAIKIAGDTYSGGPIGSVPGAGNSLTIQGNAALSANSCPFNSATNPAVTGSCSGSQAAPAGAPSAQTLVVPTTAAPGSKQQSGCTILYPGKYTSPPSFNSNRGYYLASGTYYFTAGDIVLDGWIQGGAPAATTPALSNGFTSRCPTSWANDANAKIKQGLYNYTGTGVTIILGGNAVLRFADDVNDRVELFPRVATTGSPDLAATPGVSIWGQMNSTAGVTVPASYTKMTQPIPYYTNGEVEDVVIHGLTFLPDSQLSISPLPNTDGGGVAQFKGGVVANSLSLVLDNLTAGSSPIIAGTPSIVSVARTITITSVATPADGGAATTVKVVATYPTTANAYPTIVSWRKV